MEKVFSFAKFTDGSARRPSLFHVHACKFEGGLQQNLTFQQTLEEPTAV
jgi:hypothetical protein